MRKTTTNKWYNLIKKRIHSDKNARLTNIGKNHITLLNLVKERGLFILDKLRKIVYQILAKDTSLNVRGIYFKFTQRNFNINFYKTRKDLKQLGYRQRKMKLKIKRIKTIEMKTNRITYANTIRRINIQNLLFLNKTSFNLYILVNYRHSLDKARPYHISI